MIEFERKFLVDFDRLNSTSLNVIDVFDIKQVYVCSSPDAVVRLRRQQSLRSSTPVWYFTIKKDTGHVAKKHEFEYVVPDASDLFSTFPKMVHKVRKVIPLVMGANDNQLFIELDYFMGRHEGRIVAEVELKCEKDSEILDANLPPWFSLEVTGKKEYSNYSMYMEE